MVRLNLAVAALAAGVLSASASSSQKLRGVAPADAHRYQPTESVEGAPRWQCLDGSKQLPWSAVNDDYCDCADGSDEPGTSACANATFYCANHGHEPAYLRSSRVDDGICDPECCDGSDERDGKVSCPDRCEAVGRQHRKRLAQLENVRRAGAKIRERYIADGRKQKDALHAEIAKLEVDLAVAKQNEQRLKNELARAETVDKALIEAKAKTPLYAKLNDHHAAIRTLAERNAALRRELETLTLLLDDLAKGYNPNYQDMAVKGAVVAYNDWRGIKREPSSADEASADASADAQADVPAATATAKLEALLDQGEWTAERVARLLGEDPLDIMDGGLAATGDRRVAAEGEAGLLFRIHEYLPDGLVPYFEAMVDTLLDVLLKANVITDVKRMRPKSGAGEAEPENVAVARRAHADAAASVARLDNDLATRRHVLGEYARYGREAEFKALESTCVTKDLGEYTYEYCFYGRATQMPNKGGAPISLGTFANWNPRNDHSWQSDAYWRQQIYTRGQKCWNGPERSAIVDLECATTNALLDVFEAEKCIYSIKLTTPAVCFPPNNSTTQPHQPQQQQQQQAQPKEMHEHALKDEL